MKRLMIAGGAVAAAAVVFAVLHLPMSGCAPGTHDTAWERRLPRALFLTTGLNYGNGTLAPGVNEAVQALNRYGIPVRLENREVLYDSTLLAGYDLIIALTATGYHDADRMHSLIYMTHEEMERLRRWVFDGGFLVAGENIGRYYLDGTDRARFTGHRLTGETWPLGKCFGVTLEEKNMHGFTLAGSWKADTVAAWTYAADDRWRMVPVERYPSVRVPARWQRDTLAYPAVTEYGYGSGRGLLLASSYLLQPAGAGGWLGAADVRQFYRCIAAELLQPADTALGVQLHPWPDAAPYAMCATLDAEGTPLEFENVVNLLQDHGVQPSFYVNAHLDPAVEMALRTRGFTLHSRGFDPVHSSRLDCHGTRLNVLRNQQHWDRHFKGFRFPHGSASFAGLQTLAARGYLFDNSVGVDNVDALAGCAVPYNIPLNNTGFSMPPPAGSFYASSDLMEVSPVLHDDYHFFGRVGSTDGYPEADQRLDAGRYERYLQRFIEGAVRPCRGVASYFGHVSNTGFNDVTLRSLREFIRTGLRDSAWIAGIDEIAQYRRDLMLLRFVVRERKNELAVTVSGPDDVALDGCTLRFASKPVAAEARGGTARVQRETGGWFVTFAAFNGQELLLRF